MENPIDKAIRIVAEGLEEVAELEKKKLMK